MLFQETVDVGHVDARAGRDAALARGVEQVRLLALDLGHGRDDRLLTADHAVVDAGLGHLALHLGHAGQQAHDAFEPAHLLHLGQLVGEVVEVELALGQLPGGLFGLGVVEVLGSLFDEGDDVALAEDAAGDAAGVEHLEGVDLFAGAQIFDRQAGDGPHRQHGPAAPVAVGAGQHQTRQGQALMEGLGRAHRVLTGQAVGDQQGLDRLGHGGDFGHLGHQAFVEGDAAGGVEDQDIEALQLRRRQGASGDLDRALARHDRQGGDLDLLTQLGQLLHGRRTTRVQRGHHDLLAVELGQTQRQLGRGRGLARALQAGHQDHGRRRGVQVDRRRLVAAQHLDQTVIDDLDDLIGRLDRADDLFARGLLGGEGDEVLDDGQGDVGLEQGHAHFAHRRIDIRLGQHAATGDPVEHA